MLQDITVLIKGAVERNVTGDGDAKMVQFTRRRVLLGGAAVLTLGVAGAGYGEISGALPGHTSFRQALGLDGPNGTVPAAATSVSMEREYSSARGVEVNLAVMSPAGVSRAGLPVVVVLHGRSGSAQQMVQIGFPQFLTAAVAAGAAPFVLLAVDGGDDTYWHPVTTVGKRDDPQAMLMNEVPQWMAKYGLGSTAAAPQPDGVIGISMGGFGAFLYAYNRRMVQSASGRPPLSVVAALSPAVFEDWSDANSVGAFSSAADWAGSEPLQHVSSLQGQKCAIWCGKDDPFYAASQLLAKEIPGSESFFSPGAHTTGYWTRVIPAALQFLGHSGMA